MKNKFKILIFAILLLFQLIAIEIVFLTKDYKNFETQQLNSNVENSTRDAVTPGCAIRDFMVGTDFIEFEIDLWGSDSVDYLSDDSWTNNVSTGFEIYKETDGEDGNTASDTKIYEVSGLKPDYWGWDFTSSHPYMIKWVHIGNEELKGDVEDDIDTQNDPSNPNDNEVLYLFDGSEKSKDMGELQRWNETILNNQLSDGEDSFTPGGTYYLVSVENNLEGESESVGFTTKEFSIPESKKEFTINSSIDKELYDTDEIDYRNVINTEYISLSTAYFSSKDDDEIVGENNRFITKFGLINLEDYDKESQLLIDDNVEEIWNGNENEIIMDEKNISIYNQDEHPEVFEQDWFMGEDFYFQTKNYYYHSTEPKLIEFKYTHKFSQTSDLVTVADDKSSYWRTIYYEIHFDAEVVKEKPLQIKAPILPTWYGPSSPIDDFQQWFYFDSTSQSDGLDCELIFYIRFFIDNNNVINEEDNMFFNMNYLDFYKYGTFFDISKIDDNGTEKVMPFVDGDFDSTSGDTVYFQKLEDYYEPENPYPTWIGINFKWKQARATNYTYKINFLTKDFQEQKKEEGVLLSEASWNYSDVNINPQNVEVASDSFIEGVNSFEDGDLEITESKNIFGDYAIDDTYDVTFSIKTRTDDGSGYYLKHDPENVEMYLINADDSNERININETQLIYKGSKDGEVQSLDNGFTYKSMTDSYEITGIETGKNWNLYAKKDGVIGESNDSDYVEIGSFEYYKESTLVNGSLNLQSGQKSISGDFLVVNDGNDKYEQLTNDDFEIKISEVGVDDGEEYVVPSENISIGKPSSTSDGSRETVKFSYDDNSGGNSLKPNTKYNVTVNLRENSLSEEIETSEWTEASKPTIDSFELSDPKSTSIGVSYSITNESPSDPSTQGTAEITNISVVDSEDDTVIYKDFGNDPKLVINNETISGLEKETTYSMKLIVKYYDSSNPDSLKTIESNIETITTTSGSNLEPTFDLTTETSRTDAYIFFEIYDGIDAETTTIINDVKLFIDDNEIPIIDTETSNSSEINCSLSYDTGDHKKGSFNISNLEPGTSYEFYLIVNYDDDLEQKSDVNEFKTEDINEPNSPSLDTDYSELVPDFSLNSWVYNYKIDNEQSDGIDCIVKEIRIGKDSDDDYYGKETNIDTSNQEITGSIKLENIDFNSKYGSDSENNSSIENEFVVKIIYKGTSSSTEEVVKYNDFETTSDYNETNPEVLERSVLNNNVSQTSARIDYSFIAPDVEFGDEQIVIEKVELFDGVSDDPIDKSSNSTGSFVINDLTPGTIYSSYKLSVTFHYEIPNYAINNSGEIDGGKITADYDVKEFETLSDEISTSDYIKYIGSKKDYIELGIYIFDPDDNFDLNTGLRLKVKVDGVEEELKVFGVQKVENNVDEIEGKNYYEFKVSGINFSENYTNWEISVTSDEDNEPNWVSVHLVSAETGEDIPTFVLHKLSKAEIILIVVLILLFILIIFIIIVVKIIMGIRRKQSW